MIKFVRRRFWELEQEQLALLCLVVPKFRDLNLEGVFS